MNQDYAQCRTALFATAFQKNLTLLRRVWPRQEKTMRTLINQLFRLRA